MPFEKITEQASLYQNLEQKTTLELLTDINQEDQKVALAVEKAIPIIAKAIDKIVNRMQEGGRLFYLGAGTSGRLGVLDASEILPTYGVSNRIIGLIAGGDNALRNPIEGAEDDQEQGWKDLQNYEVNEKDSVIGIAASGGTPYIIGALKKCREHKILSIAIACNPDSPIAEQADIAIEIIVGPEFVTGSSRMKAGTAQKLVLNMISTSIMIKLGRVKGNKMVNMQISNQKLIDRATKMIVELSELNYEEAKKMLMKHGSVKVVMEQIKIS